MGGPLSTRGDQFAREAVHCFLVVSSYSHAQLNFRRVGDGDGGRSVTCVDSEVLRVDLVELEAELSQARANDPIGGLGLFESLRPAIHERTDGLVAVGVADGKLQTYRFGVVL